MISTAVRNFPMRIDGRPVETSQLFEIRDPSTGGVVATAACGGARDIDNAVEAAKRTFATGEWSRSNPAERVKVLRATAAAMTERIDELVELEIMANGATVRQATALHIGYAISHLEYFAGLAERYQFERTMPRTTGPTLAQAVVRREPIGVCGAIAPWNFPLLLAMWKVAPALAVGNSVVVKPDEKTPLTMLEFVRIAEDCGLPPGVLNVIPGLGPDAGARLAAHPDVGKIGFTGSTEVGREVMRLASDAVKHVTLELGGKSPTIMLDDADIELAVDGVLYGCMLYSGQACESGTRLLVPEHLHDDVVDLLVERAKTIKLGPTRDWDTDMGPVMSAEQHARVLTYVDNAHAEGARLVCGGGIPDGTEFNRGFWLEPTIFTDVSQSMRIAREEIFGPVLSVLRYSDDAEAVRIANDTDYGLVATVWSTDNARALDMAEQVQAGTVWINDHHMIDCQLPFGGYKQSGVGRELGPDALDPFTEQKTVLLDLSGKRERRAYGLLLSHAEE
ncbi:aldehyde dehydrogenase [Mycobacterium sp. URHB0044]|jgi:aldehyde dehydrogenase (NAD+)|uniref:aldehyde dehydrogenase family protein n=1 Tax=Mycobacterium sp. URHB0044 TaxID=1380386 RepID=UPI00048B4D65|nr:aldehyde dehydrogenase family protein [Mycobacterium sp. URHB0044]